GVLDEPTDVAVHRSAPPSRSSPPKNRTATARERARRDAKRAPVAHRLPKAASKATNHPRRGAAEPPRSLSHAAAASGPIPQWSAPGTRHPAGLAIDVGAVHKRDGRWLNIGSHFHGRIGDRTCGAGVHLPEEPEARELHSIVCESSDLGVFTYVLTPNYNAAHADHYHMEIKPGVRWFLYN